MRALLLCGCALLVVAPSPASATTYHVAPDGSGDFPTIQAAIDAAASGDEIVLSDGTFMGNGNWNLDFGTKDLVLRSENGYDATFIDGGFDCNEETPFRWALSVQGGQTSATRIDGLTIQRFLSVGGVVRISDSQPDLRNLRFRLNHGWHDDFHGLDIVVWSSLPRIQDCSFEDNGCDPGYRAAIYARQSKPTIERCSFRFLNSAGVDIDSGTLADCIFEHCDADLYPPGPGLLVYLAGGEVSVVRCRFAGNYASGIDSYADELLVQDCLFEEIAGDIITSIAAYRGNLVVRNTTFARTEGAAWGHVVYAGDSASLDHCVFVANQAANGGTVRIGDQGRLVLSHCTFAANTGSQVDSAVEIGEGAFVSIDHTIMASNGLPESTFPVILCHGTPAQLQVSCTDIFGNAPGDWTGCVTGMNGVDGNFQLDPLFCSLATREVGLNVGSPCAPANNGECGLVGALEVSCGASSVEARTWGSIKALYR